MSYKRNCLNPFKKNQLPLKSPWNPSGLLFLESKVEKNVNVREVTSLKQDLNKKDAETEKLNKENPKIER